MRELLIASSMCNMCFPEKNEQNISVLSCVHFRKSNWIRLGFSGEVCLRLDE